MQAPQQFVKILKPINMRKISPETNIYLEISPPIPSGAPILAVFINDKCVANQVPALPKVTLRDLPLGECKLSVALLTKSGAVLQDTVQVVITDNLRSSRSTRTQTEKLTTKKKRVKKVVSGPTPAIPEVKAQEIPKTSQIVRKPSPPPSDLKIVRQKTASHPLKYEDSSESSEEKLQEPTKEPEEAKVSSPEEEESSSSSDTVVTLSAPVRVVEATSLKAPKAPESPQTGVKVIEATMIKTLTQAPSSSSTESEAEVGEESDVSASTASTEEEASLSVAESSPLEGTYAGSQDDSSPEFKPWNFRNTLTALAFRGVDLESSSESSEETITKPRPLTMVESGKIPQGVHTVYARGGRALSLDLPEPKLDTSIYILNNTTASLLLRSSKGQELRTIPPGESLTATVTAKGAWESD